MLEITQAVGLKIEKSLFDDKRLRSSCIRHQRAYLKALEKLRRETPTYRNMVPPEINFVFTY